MHASSLENMRKAIDRYLGRDFFAGARRRVVEVGSTNVNGSYRQLLADVDIEYIGLDLAPGKGVDIVLDDPYVYPLSDGCADVVISGQMLEHCEFFWKTFGEMVRLLAPDGYLILVAPSAGPVHRHPVDCYRFYPDSYHALARLTGCHLVALWNDERGPWRDLVGVFSKNADAGNRPPILPVLKWTNRPVPEGPPELEVTAGAGSYLEALSRIHQRLQPQYYLEIGVRKGDSLALAECDAVAVDPTPTPNVQIGARVRLYRSTSDDFFDFEAQKAIVSAVDLVFIDGMHLFENVLRDFIQIERRCTPTSVIVIDDIFPNTAEQGSRARKTRVWTGDVWKIVLCLQEQRPDLRLYLLDSSPTGLLVVMGLDPANKVFVDRYNPIAAAFHSERFEAPPRSIITREGSCPPDDPGLLSALDSLRTLRPSRPGVNVVRGVLKNLDGKRS